MGSGGTAWRDQQVLNQVPPKFGISDFRKQTDGKGALRNNHAVGQQPPHGGFLSMELV